MSLAQRRLSRKACKGAYVSWYTIHAACGDTQSTTTPNCQGVDTLGIYRRGSKGGLWGSDEYPLSVQSAARNVCGLSRRGVFDGA